MEITTIENKPEIIHKVKQINGHFLEVQNATEKSYYQDQQKKYLKENKFTNVSDLADLDRLLVLELMVFRWNGNLSSGRDINGYLIASEVEQIRKNIKETAVTISQIKNDLGLSGNQRQKEQTESIANYINTLKQRAKQHGIRREKQLTKALCLIEELSSIVGTYDRTNQLERKKVGIESEADIVGWVRETLIPQYREIDTYFREHQQKFWVGEN